MKRKQLDRPGWERIRERTYCRHRIDRAELEQALRDGLIAREQRDMAVETALALVTRTMTGVLDLEALCRPLYEAFYSEESL